MHNVQHLVSYLLSSLFCSIIQSIAFVKCTWIVVTQLLHSIVGFLLAQRNRTSCSNSQSLNIMLEITLRKYFAFFVVIKLHSSEVRKTNNNADNRSERTITEWYDQKKQLPYEREKWKYFKHIHVVLILSSLYSEGSEVQSRWCPGIQR